MNCKYKTQKKNALAQLQKARKCNKTDKAIEKLVDLINASDSMYTTSTCSGRICLLETNERYEKISSKFLARWHNTVNLEQISEALKKHRGRVVYLKAECPILHIITKDIETAKRLLAIALESGFKRSGIKTIKTNRILVEVCSTETLDVPIVAETKQLANDSYLRYLIKIANLRWELGQEKLRRLYNNIVACADELAIQH